MSDSPAPRFNRSGFIDALDLGRSDFLASAHGHAANPVLVLQLKDGRTLPVSSLVFARHSATEPTASHEADTHTDDWFQAKVDPLYADFSGGTPLGTLMMPLSSISSFHFVPAIEGDADMADKAHSIRVFPERSRRRSKAPATEGNPQ